MTLSYQPATEHHNIVPDGYDIGRCTIRYSTSTCCLSLPGMNWSRQRSVRQATAVFPTPQQPRTSLVYLRQDRRVSTTVCQSLRHSLISQKLIPVGSRHFSGWNHNALDGDNRLICLTGFCCIYCPRHVEPVMTCVRRVSGSVLHLIVSGVRSSSCLVVLSGYA